MNRNVKKLLIEEILTVDAADTESHLLEWQSLNQVTTKTLNSSQDAESLTQTVESIAKAKTTSLEAFLERKKLIRETLEGF